MMTGRPGDSVETPPCALAMFTARKSMAELLTTLLALVGKYGAGLDEVVAVLCGRISRFTCW